MCDLTQGTEVPISYFPCVKADSANTYTETCVATSQESYSDIAGVSMKITALFTAPFTYLASSGPKAGKDTISTKRTKSRAKPSNSAKANNHVQLKPYRGISIVFDDCACDAVKANGLKRFLVADGDAPMLPLSGCDAARCNCKYMHHDDRRDDDHDRRMSAALKTELYEDTGNSDRRLKKRGRRKSDL